MLSVILLLFKIYAAVVQDRDYYTKNGFLSPQKSFEFKIYCGPLNSTKCNSLNNTLIRVGELIANDLLVKVPVTVVVVVKREVRYNNLFYLKRIAEFTVGETKESFTVPNALAKQSSIANITNAISLPADILKGITKYLANRPDITLFVNPDNFDILTRVTRHNPVVERDLNTYVAYWLTRGLGFQSNLIFHGFPDLLIVPELSSLNQELHFEPPTLLEKHIYTPFPALKSLITFPIKSRKPYRNLADILTKFQSISIPPKDILMTKLLKNKTALAIIKELGSFPFEDMVFESHLGTKIEMKAPDVHNFQLKMPSESQQGSQDNQDLLMSLDNEFHPFTDIYSGGEYFYGPKTRQIMETIGHATREYPRNAKFKLKEGNLVYVT